MFIYSWPQVFLNHSNTLLWTLEKPTLFYNPCTILRKETLEESTIVCKIYTKSDPQFQSWI